MGRKRGHGRGGGRGAGVGFVEPGAQCGPQPTGDLIECVAAPLS